MQPEFPYSCPNVSIDLTSDVEEVIDLTVDDDVDDDLTDEITVNEINRLPHMMHMLQIRACLRTVDRDDEFDNQSLVNPDPELEDYTFSFPDGRHSYTLLSINENHEYRRTECGGRVMLPGGKEPYCVPLRSRGSGYWFGDMDLESDISF